MSFSGQKFESSTFPSSYVIVSQMVTDRANITIAINMIYMKSHMWFGLEYLDLTLAHSKG